MSINLGIITYGLDRKSTGIGRHTMDSVSAVIQKSDFKISLLTSSGAGELNQIDVSKTRLLACKLAPMLLTLGQIEIGYFNRKANFDIIHDTSAMTPLSLVGKKTKRIVTIYDVIPLSYPGHSTKWDNLVYHYWLPYIVPKVDAVLTISESSRQDIARYYKFPLEKIINIKGGKSPIFKQQSQEDIAIYREKYGLPERYILYVGELSTRKNLARLLKAFELCKEEGLAHKLVLVGPKRGKYAEVMNQFKKSELMESEIIFAGYVDTPDLPKLYSGADLFIFPSMYEGFGLPVIEAMACGTPVITSNVSSLPEVAGDGAILIDPMSIMDIKKAIQAVLGDESLQSQLRAKGLAQAGKFTWEKTAEEIMKTYEKVLA